MTYAAHHSPQGPGSVSIAQIVHSRERSGGPSWARVSGWEQLSGRPRTITCLVICRNSAPLLSRLLPLLSDALTEAGFPWEIACVDSASTDSSAALMQSWCEFPGFAWVRLAADYGAAAAVRTGLELARGDAVIVAYADAQLSIELLPDMIAKWEAGSEIVLDRQVGNEPRHLVCWSLDCPTPADGHGDDVPADPDSSRLLLLDRRAVDALIHDGLPAS